MGILGAVGFLVGVVLIGAWFAIGRRRPHRQADLLAQPAGAGLDPIPFHAAPRPPRTTVDDEANVPRWRRASVRRDRAWTPPPRTEPPPDRHAARFDTVFSSSEARRVIREDHVSLLNVPHEEFGTPLTELGTGREVELLESDDAWARVRTAWGEEGWVPSRAIGT